MLSVGLQAGLVNADAVAPRDPGRLDEVEESRGRIDHDSARLKGLGKFDELRLIFRVQNKLLSGLMRPRSGRYCKRS
jgi:hypothetical protein